MSQVFSDNGPQFSAAEFADFAQEYGFTHITSSPHFPQSNGLAEKAVSIMKNLLKKCQLSGDDPYLALLNYRATPLKNGFSPAELLMGRKLRTRLPILDQNLIPETVDPEKMRELEDIHRVKYKTYADERSGARNAPPISLNERILLKGEGKEGVVLRRHEAPRSFIIQKDDGGIVRRNRRYFVRLHTTTTMPPTHSTDVTTDQPTLKA